MIISEDDTHTQGIIPILPYLGWQLLPPCLYKERDFMLKQLKGISVLSYEKKHIDQINAVLIGVPLSPAEERTLIWLAGWEDSTVNNICSIFEKLKG